MTTYYPFTPSPLAPFAFSPTLDGAVYNCSVPFLLFGQRYYLNIQSVDGTQIWYGAIPNSPGGINLQALTWANGLAVATTVNPHGYRVGTLVNLTIAGVTPAAYNGFALCLATGPSTFSYALAANPGPVTGLGMASWGINIVGGLVNPNTGTPIAVATSMIFRTPAQQFEVSVLGPPGVAAAAAPASSGNATGLFTLGQSILGGGDVLG